MPDQRPEAPEAGSDLYRCTLRYADDVTPPEVPGEVALQEYLPDRASANQCIEEGAARTDIGRMTLERRISEDGAKDEWGVMHEWAVTADGWRIA